MRTKLLSRDLHVFDAETLTSIEMSHFKSTKTFVSIYAKEMNTECLRALNRSVKYYLSIIQKYNVIVLYIYIYTL